LRENPAGRVQQTPDRDHQRLRAVHRENDPLGRLGVDQRCQAMTAGVDDLPAVPGLDVGPRPAEAPQVRAKSTIASVTPSGLGKLVAELSR